MLLDLSISLQDIGESALLIIAGLAAGMVNTLAGNGSVFTLSALIFLGLPIDIANGTNRIGTTLQSITAVSVFRKHDKNLFDYSWPYVLPSFIGAQIGAWVVADIVSRELLNWIIGAIMLGLLVLVLANPKKGLKEGIDKKVNPWVRAVVFFAIGFYGGFIQAGIGILLLVSLVNIAGHSLVRSNAIKLVVVLAYSIPVSCIFLWYDQVNWSMGIWLAVGQVIGSFTAARFAVKSSKANQWIRGLLIVMILLAVAKLFGVFG